MKITWLTAGWIALTVAACTANAGEYQTKHGNAILTVTTSTRAKGVLQIHAELQPRNVARIDRVFLVSPSHKKLKPTDKTVFAEQTTESSDGKKEQVQLDAEHSSGTYLANAYLFEVSAGENPKGRWFFYTEGAGSRGQDAGFRVEIPAKDVEAVLQGEPVP